MLIIFAHAGDEIARRLAAAWSSDARLLCPGDLSANGWSHFPVGGGSDAIGIGGAPVAASAVTGVLVRIGAVSAADLPHIAEEDRNYVAAEMSAFLLSLLTRLRCPVVNRPTAASLMAPGWSHPRWRAAAVAAGIGVADGEAGTLVTVVGDQCIGAENARVARCALALARAANVDLLPVRMTADARFVEAELWAEPPPAAVAALRGLFAAPVEYAS